MFRFYPKKLATSLAYVNSVIIGLTYLKEPVEKQHEPPDESSSAHALSSLSSLKKVCESIGLETSMTLIEDAVGMVTPSENWQPHRGLVKEQLQGVISTVTAELGGVIFLRINKSDQEFYEKESPFGDQVRDNFPAASYDITEAGKCLALNRSTACVLHLMRVLEVGLNSLADYFKVPFAYTSWDTVIGQIELKIKNIEKEQIKPDTWKDDRKFFSATANQFRYFKDSWRNYAMHVHDKYTPEEALIVYTSVKVFMEQIAKKLAQP